jgi:hypothetical protein
MRTGFTEEVRVVIFEGLRVNRRKTCSFSAVPLLRDDFRELPDLSSPPALVASA